MHVQIFRIIGALLLSVLLAACAHSQISAKEAFDSSSTDGLVIIGASGEQDYEVWFAQFDPESKKLNAGSFSGHEGLTHRASANGGLTYHVVRMPAGTYVLKNVTYAESPGMTAAVRTVCLSNGTYRFDVSPGRILYFGNIAFQRGLRSVTATSGDQHEAQKALQSYPNVHGQASRAELAADTFINGTDMFGGKGVCGGYYK